MGMNAASLSRVEDVRLEHSSGDIMGTGLVNQRNSCYINSVLQCLRYTAPLYNYLESGAHTGECAKRREGVFCLLCEVKRHFERTKGEDPFFPGNIVGNLSRICPLGRWAEEDAHEFLRYMVEGMHECCVYGRGAMGRRREMTSIIYRIFCGYLRNQVVCRECRGRSTKYEPFLDLALDVAETSVARGLARFVAPEELVADNRYFCPRCRRAVPASKRMTIDQPPNLLTLQLKKVTYANQDCHKASHQIAFSHLLDLRPFMTHPGPPHLYRLYALIVHQGSRYQGGHYFAHIRSGHGTWYIANDKHVQVTTPAEVTDANPYLLFYIRADRPTSLRHHVRPRSLRPIHRLDPASLTLLSTAHRGTLRIRMRPNTPHSRRALAAFWKSQSD